jgi:AraC family transcriptional regulator of arabinose operon
MKMLYVSYSTRTKPFKTKLHVIDYYYIHLQVKGYCQVLLDGAMVTAGPGDLLVYLPNSTFFLEVGQALLHSNGHDIPCEFYNIGCLGSQVDQWWHSSQPPQKMKIPMNANLLHILKTLVLERLENIEEEGEQEVKSEIYYHLLQTMFLYIDRAIRQATSHNHNIDVYLMKEYIERHATQSFKLEDVARHVGLSVSRSVHLFKAVFGKTIKQYALEVRLTIACDRIQFSNMTLEEIADSCGFSSYSYFHRAFRSKFRMSPKQYRHIQQKQVDHGTF